MRKHPWLALLLAAALLSVVMCLAGAALYNLPSIHERLAWRVDSLRQQIRRAINPPEQHVFVPQGPLAASPSSTLPPPAVHTMAGSATPESVAALVSEAAAAAPQPSPTPSPVSAVTFAPPPEKVALTGAVHEYQQFNNCGPATLAMDLSFWGWQGDQRDTRWALRPNFATVDDKNVNPWEMVAYVEDQAGLNALARVGGDLETVKRLIAAGYPVVVETGIQHKPRDWMGHYLLLTGYDDERGRFITQDALVGPDIPLSYAEFENDWRAFNRVFLGLARRPARYPPGAAPELCHRR